LNDYCGDLPAVPSKEFLIEVLHENNLEIDGSPEILLDCLKTITKKNVHEYN
tara:strand:- start:353 stop:508 length:156 start_codon:yes stop_codon:yes gene_type:complete